MITRRVPQLSYILKHGVLVEETRVGRLCQYFCVKINDTRKMSQLLCRFLKWKINVTNFDLPDNKSFV